MVAVTEREAQIRDDIAAGRPQDPWAQAKDLLGLLDQARAEIELLSGAWSLGYCAALKEHPAGPVSLDERQAIARIARALAIKEASTWDHLQWEQELRNLSIVMPSKSAAEVNAERIEAIVATHSPHLGPRAIARKIVEAFPALRPPQFTSERDGSSRVADPGVPWLHRSP